MYCNVHVVHVVHSLLYSAERYYSAMYCTVHTVLCSAIQYSIGQYCIGQYCLVHRHVLHCSVPLPLSSTRPPSPQWCERKGLQGSNTNTTGRTLSGFSQRPPSPPPTHTYIHMHEHIHANTGTPTYACMFSTLT